MRLFINHTHTQYSYTRSWDWSAACVKGRSLQLSWKSTCYFASQTMMSPCMLTPIQCTCTSVTCKNVFIWEIFHRAKCKIIVFARFCSLNFPHAKTSWWSDGDVSIILACTTFSLPLFKIWSVRVEVLHVILVVTLISCFNPRVEKNSI